MISQLRSRSDHVRILSSNEVENWQIDLVDTGSNCMTGGRIARAYDRYYTNKEIFGVTYGDGICDMTFKVHSIFIKIMVLSALSLV